MKPEAHLPSPTPRLRRSLRFERPPVAPGLSPPPLPVEEPVWQEGDPVPGTQYRYLRELGRGVQGLAIEVEHAFLGARAAMKILRAQHVSRRSVAARVRDEARALVELRHPNIVRVTDGGMTAEREPRPFFVMELLKGDTLRAIAKKAGGALEVRQSIDVAIDILDALDHAHARNMVHRDVKPANIFLTRGGVAQRAILLDFGIASVARPGGDNRAGFSGTYEYAAPEQLDGYLTAQSDVYALATVLYVCLAGRHPFAGVPNRDELAHLQRHAVAPSLDTVRDDVPAALADLIATAMEKDPARRPKSAFAFAQKLRDVRTALHAPKARAQVAASLEASRGTTDRLLLDLREADPPTAGDETTHAVERDATTSMAETCIFVRPEPPPVAAPVPVAAPAPASSTSILVAPWLPPKPSEPAVPASPRPGRPRRMVHHPKPKAKTSPSLSRVTVTAPRTVEPVAETSSAARAVTLDLGPSSIAEHVVEAPPSLGTTQRVRAPAQEARLAALGSRALAALRALFPAAPIEVVVTFVLFFFVLGGLLAMWLAAVAFG